MAYFDEGAVVAEGWADDAGLLVLGAVVEPVAAVEAPEVEAEPEPEEREFWPTQAVLAVG